VRTLDEHAALRFIFADLMPQTCQVSHLTAVCWSATAGQSENHRRPTVRHLISLVRVAQKASETSMNDGDNTAQSKGLQTTAFPEPLTHSAVEAARVQEVFRSLEAQKPVLTVRSLDIP